MDEKLWQKEFWNQQEAADLLNVSPGTIHNWRVEGLLPYIQPPGKKVVLIPVNAVKEFIGRYTINKKGGDKTRKLDKVKRKKPDVSPTTGKKWRV